MKAKRLGSMPLWQKIFVMFSFILCALSGILYFFYPQINLLSVIVSSRLVLAIHGIASTFSLISLGIVLSVHIKIGWLVKSNRLSGVIQLLSLIALLVTGCSLYYGPQSIREITLKMHYVFGFLFTVCFLSHVWRPKLNQGHQNIASISLRTR
jgi:hypothetical protein